MRPPIHVTPPEENVVVKVAVVLIVSVYATVHAFVVSIGRTVATRWRSR